MAGWRDFREIGAWQLAYQLRRKCLPLLRRTLKARDYDLHRQVREAARSAPRNIAEGFGRYKHKNFAQFVRIAKSSEVELLNHFKEAFNCKFLNRTELEELRHAARKAIKAANGLIRYLESTPDVD